MKYMKIKERNFKRAFGIIIVIDLAIAYLIGMMNFPSADYSNIDPLLILTHEILALIFLAGFGFAFMFLGAWIVIRNGNNKILEMENKKEEN